jgi:hypothetical protein
VVIRTAGPVEAVPAGDLGGPAGAGGTGLVLGQDRTGGLVAVPLFGPRPTLAVAVGGVRFAVLLGFRALALGARISIESARPTQWDLLVRLGAERDRDAPDRPAALPPRPRLAITEQPAVGVDPAPWSTTLVVRPALTPADADTIRRADLVLAQPLAPAQADLLAAALGRPAEAGAYTLPRPDSVIVLSAEPTRVVRLAPTLIEYHLIGDPADH